LTTAARGVTRRVTVDRHYREFSDSLIVFMITQSGLTREEFYGQYGSDKTAEAAPTPPGMGARPAN
jgi:hypothetical protein